MSFRQNQFTIEQVQEYYIKAGSKILASLKNELNFPYHSVINMQADI